MEELDDPGILEKPTPRSGIEKTGQAHVQIGHSEKHRPKKENKARYQEIRCESFFRHYHSPTMLKSLLILSPAALCKDDRNITIWSSN